MIKDKLSKEKFSSKKSKVKIDIVLGGDVLDLYKKLAKKMKIKDYKTLISLVLKGLV